MNTKPAIPVEVVGKWQMIVDIMSEVINVPTGLITKVHEQEIEVLVSSDSDRNPYERGERARLNIGLYCETVMAKRAQLLVPDARKDPEWDHNPDIELGMVSYLGLPLIWPDGEIFGTICVLDSQENHYSKAHQRLHVQSREAVELDLQMVTRVRETELLNSAMVNLLEDLRFSNENLESTTRRLKEANRELEAFAYSVSHDLRAPLRAVSGFSQMLAEDYGDKLDSDGRHQLEVIQAGARDMGQLIDDLLSFSRLGRTKMSASVIDMGGLVREVFEKLQLPEDKREVRLRVEELAATCGDRKMIFQVFINLLSNAIKFTKPREAAVIEVGCRAEGEEQIYSVRDNGVGFDMKYSDKLFRVFQRLHRKEEFEGTGIGLALVQRIIHRHGGRVWAESKVNEGATFYFTLPGEEEREDG